MNIYIAILLVFLGFNLAGKVRPGEPWALRWAWLFTISMLAFGISNGTNSDFYQWLVGSLQGLLLSVFVCEMRLFWLKHYSSRK